MDILFSGWHFGFIFCFFVHLSSDLHIVSLSFLTSVTYIREGNFFKCNDLKLFQYFYICLWRECIFIMFNNVYYNSKGFLIYVDKSKFVLTKVNDQLLCLVAEWPRAYLRFWHASFSPALLHPPITTYMEADSGHKIRYMPVSRKSLCLFKPSKTCLKWTASLYL